MNKGGCRITNKNKGVYEIKCNIENKVCRVLIKMRRGPSEEIICDNKDNNITNFVKEFKNYTYIGFVPKYYDYEYIKVNNEEDEYIISNNESY
jgi:hypothetical protein